MKILQVLKKIITFGEHPLYKEGIKLYNEGLFEEALEKFKGLTESPIGEKSLHYNLACFYSALSHRNLGLIFLHKADYAKAVYHFNKALQFNPSLYEVYVYLGIAYNNWHKYDDAMKAFNKVLKLAPDLLDIKYKLSIVLYNKGKYKEALKELSYLTKLNPQFADLHYHLGVIYAHLTRFAEAKNELKKAIELNPKYLQARIQFALVSAAQGEYEIAEKQLTDLISERPNFPDLYYNRGTVQAAQDKIKKAFESLNKALSLNPNYAKCHFFIGILYLREGRNKEALEHISKALEGKLDEPMFSFARTIKKFLTKKIERKLPEEAMEKRIFPLDPDYIKETVKSLPRHVNIVPDYVEIFEKLGTKIDQPLLKTIANLYKEEIEKNPMYPDLYYQLGKVYEYMEEWDEAIKSYHKSLDLNPKFIKARINLAKVYKNLLIYEEAKKHFLLLRKQGVLFPDLCLELAAIYIEEENLEEALNTVFEAINRNPRYEKAYLLASVIYEKMGDTDNAIQILQKYKDYNKSFSEQFELRLLELSKRVNSS